MRTRLRRLVQLVRKWIECGRSATTQEPFDNAFNIQLDYPVHPRSRYGGNLPAHPQIYTMFNDERDNYRLLQEEFLKYSEYFWNIPIHNPNKIGDPHWQNGYLPAFDAIVLYSLLADHRPSTFLEIGSGNSTKFAKRAINDHTMRTRIISIDPHPRADIDHLCDAIIRAPLEDVDLAVFNMLETGDFLFMDGSHRTFTNSDSTVFFLDILPRLKPGIWVEIHDIHLPYDYPDSLNDLYYSEQYLLATYLLGGAAKTKTVLPNCFVSNDPELSHVLDPIWSDLRMVGVEKNGVSYWMQTTS